MKEGLTEIIFVLDESGSMYKAKSDTIGGFNEFIDAQKKLPGDVIFTFVKFNERYNVVHDVVNLQIAEPLNESTYHPSSNTRLLDAVGKTIDVVGMRLAELPESERPEKVMFVILTDGQENDSQEYKLPAGRVATMVKEQMEKYKWEFVFMGANIDAWAQGSAMNMRNTVNTSYSDMKRSIKASGLYTANYRMNKSMSMDSFNLAEEEIDAQLASMAKEPEPDKK